MIGISIKSGPNWGNSSQYQALESNFRRAIRVQNQSGGSQRIQPVLGICYGRTRTRDTGLYLKITGQNFWHFVSGDPDLFIEIIEPLGYRAIEHNQAFQDKREILLTELIKQFDADFCDDDGLVNWEKLVRFNSGNYTA